MDLSKVSNHLSKYTEAVSSDPFPPKPFRTQIVQIHFFQKTQHISFCHVCFLLGPPIAAVMPPTAKSESINSFGLRLFKVLLKKQNKTKTAPLRMLLICSCWIIFPACIYLPVNVCRQTVQLEIFKHHSVCTGINRQDKVLS